MELIKKLNRLQCGLQKGISWYSSSYRRHATRLVKDARRRRWHQREEILVWIYLARLLFITLLKSEYENVFNIYCEYDPLANFLASLSIFKRIVASQIILMFGMALALLTILLHHFIYFTPTKNVIWGGPYDFAVRNTKHYRASLRKPTHCFNVYPILWYCAYHRIFNGLNSQQSLTKYIKLDLFNNGQYKYFFDVQPRTRFRLLMMLSFGENFSSIMMFCAGKSDITSLSLPGSYVLIFSYISYLF